MIPCDRECVNEGSRARIRTLGAMSDQGQPPHLPYDELRARLGEDERARRSLEELHAATTHAEAERSHIEQHLGILRAIPAIATLIENWYDMPATQSWLKTLSDIGL